MILPIAAFLIWILVSGPILVIGMRNECGTLRGKMGFVAIWAVVNCGPLAALVIWVWKR
ncbi:TPA: hypothetical protein QDA71_005089 [Burkholderia vietnamiensis]|uniref:hypothetical protein n=1 Tax=Burkholderia vietnamiensis TaxID=60552 RepID=UPI000AB4789B|nr:hypothetical protein [Burkholderia vietnamiensis]HDR8948039.1 hypothetical protein [Burkholderia vietnamiensis]